MERIQKDPNFTARAALAKTSEEFAEPLQCNDTANHTTLIKARDRFYNNYRLNFVTQVERCVREYWAITREENRWRVNWDGLVASLKE